MLRLRRHLLGQATRPVRRHGRRQGGGYRANRRQHGPLRRLRLPDEHRRGAETPPNSRFPPSTSPNSSWSAPNDRGRGGFSQQFQKGPERRAVAAQSPRRHGHHGATAADPVRRSGSARTVAGARRRHPPAGAAPTAGIAGATGAEMHRKRHSGALGRNPGGSQPDLPGHHPAPSRQPGHQGQVDGVRGNAPQPLPGRTGHRGAGNRSRRVHHPTGSRNAIAHHRPRHPQEPRPDRPPVSREDSQRPLHRGRRRAERHRPPSACAKSFSPGKSGSAA